TNWPLVISGRDSPYPPLAISAAAINQIQSECPVDMACMDTFDSSGGTLNFLISDDEWQVVFRGFDCDLLKPGTHYDERSLVRFLTFQQLQMRRRKRSQAPPEPGQYWSPPPPSGPAWTIGARSPGPTPYQPEAGPGDYDDRLDMHTGPAFTLRPRTSSPPPDPVPGPGTYNDAKPFPNPLGTVISRPRAHTERDPVYITDMGGPYDDTMKPRRSPGRPSRKVTFHQDTLFRDSMEPTYNGRVRLEESTVSGPGGAVVPPPRTRGPVVAPVTYLVPSPPRESDISAGTTISRYSGQGTKDPQSRIAIASPRSQQQQQQQQQQRRWMGGDHIPTSQDQQQQQVIGNLPPRRQAIQTGQGMAGQRHRPASRERQRRQQQPQPQRSAGKGTAPAGSAAAGSMSSDVNPRDTEVERAMEMYRRVALEKRYLAAVGAAAGGEFGDDGGGSSGNGDIRLATAGGGGGRVVAGVRSSPQQQRLQSPLQKQQAGRAGAMTAQKPRAGTPTPGRRPPAPTSARAGGGGGGRGGGGSSLLARPVTYPQQQHYMAELAAHQAASELERKGNVATAVRPPTQPQQPVQPPSAAEQAVVARAQQVAGRQVLWTAAAEGRTAPGLGGPPAMTQGPMGVPVARARRGLEAAGVLGGPSTAGLSPRDAALARAAAYMAGRGASDFIPSGLGEAVSSAHASVTAAADAGVVATIAERARPASVGTQAGPEYAPRAPRVMSAPAGGISAAGGRPPSRGRSGSRVVPQAADRRSAAAPSAAAGHWGLNAAVALSAPKGDHRRSGAVSARN
ncbi:hypothetical protein Vafri_11773, partial [Volvox africanus]